MKTILRLIAKLLYKLMRWTYDDLPDYWSEKQVVIGFPHTSNLDTVRALSYILICKGDVKLMIKEEVFIWPLSVFLRSLGGIPVKRDKSTGIVSKMITEFNSRDTFILAIVPEGTRKKVSRVKTGFWNIAHGANVPIVCWYLDNDIKMTKWIGKIMPSDNMEKDLLKIKTIYEQHGYSIPFGKKNEGINVGTTKK